MTLSLNMLYVHGTSLGYGRYGVKLAEALERRGVDIFDDLPSPDPEAHALPFKDGSRRSGIRNVVCWVSTPGHSRGWYDGQHAVLSTMWESQSLPESFRESMHNFETVIVPSPHNVELFGQYHPNVRQVLLGVDPDQWHYTERTEPGLFFDYLIGGSGPRKGTDLAVKAFRHLWGREGSWPADGPIPRLILKNPRGEAFYGDRLEIVSGRISEQAEIDLYARAHCYLQPSRGEGFGLQPLQAMAQGCPTILTDAHGHGSFAHLGYGLSTTSVPAAYFSFGPSGDWWEPSFSDLCEHMEYVYFNYSAACAFAKQGAETVAKEFTWEQTAEQFIDAIGEDLLAADYTGDQTSWVRPDVKRYLVITNQDWTADIAGTTYQFRRGERYFEMADVKRLLYEAGLLSPACLDADSDTGLTESQVAAMGTYSAAHSHCQLCGQTLGGTTRADEIFAELERASCA